MIIPTAEEILGILIPNKTNVSKEENKDSLNQNIEVLKDWVRLYCIEQARVISEKAMIIREPTGEGESSESYISNSFEGDLGYEDYIPVEYKIHKDSILNAYSLDNIK